MPCTCEGYPDERPALIEKLTRMLCYVCTRLDGSEIGEALISPSQNPELYRWWEDHKLADAIREAQEARGRQEMEMRQAAIAKLTPAERAALGLNDTFRF